MSSNNNDTTVDVSEDYPLDQKWSLSFKGKTLYKKQQSEDDWLSSYKHIFTLDTVKVFWRVINNIHLWSDLHVGSIYAFFKEDVSPSWEHPKNIHGCSYVLYLNRTQLNDDCMNEIYLNALMFLIGNGTDYHQYINGVTFDRKYRGDKITFWCCAQSDQMLDVILENLDIRKTDYTKSTLPSNDNYKIVVKVIDHHSELEKIHTADAQQQSTGGGDGGDESFQEQRRGNRDSTGQQQPRQQHRGGQGNGNRRDRDNRGGRNDSNRGGGNNDGNRDNRDNRGGKKKSQ